MPACLVDSPLMSQLDDIWGPVLRTLYLSAAKWRSLVKVVEDVHLLVLHELGRSCGSAQR
jgi:hypothetical protein